MARLSKSKNKNNSPRVGQKKADVVARNLPNELDSFTDEESGMTGTATRELETEIEKQNNKFNNTTNEKSIIPRTGPIAKNLSDPSNGQPPPCCTKKCYNCEFCGWKFRLKANLLAHIRRHTGEKPFICKCCDRRFTQSSLLTVHMRTHTGEKPFVCSLCRRSFSRSGNLRTHMRTHSNDKPYSCTFCGKMFAQRVNMELHIRIHTGQKPFRCGVCDRAFASSSNMRRHWKHIHPDSSILPSQTSTASEEEPETQEEPHSVQTPKSDFHQINTAQTMDLVPPNLQQPHANAIHSINPPQAIQLIVPPQNITPDVTNISKPVHTVANSTIQYSNPILYEERPQDFVVHVNQQPTITSVPLGYNGQLYSAMAPGVLPHFSVHPVQIQYQAYQDNITVIQNSAPPPVATTAASIPISNGVEPNTIYQRQL